MSGSFDRRAPSLGLSCPRPATPLAVASRASRTNLGTWSATCWPLWSLAFANGAVGPSCGPSREVFSRRLVTAAIPAYNGALIDGPHFCATLIPCLHRRLIGPFLRRLVPTCSTGLALHPKRLGSAHGRTSTTLCAYGGLPVCHLVGAPPRNGLILPGPLSTSPFTPLYGHPSFTFHVPFPLHSTSLSMFLTRHSQLTPLFPVTLPFPFILSRAAGRPRVC